MKDYLMLNNKKILLTPEQVKEIENSFDFNKTMLKDIKVGDTFKVGNLEFVVLDHSQGTTAVILKDLWKTAKFDSDCNNYEESEIRKDLNTGFHNELSSIVGADNIIEHTVDITADDGRTDYKKCKDKISLLTCDLYRRYVYVIEKHKIAKWWWLATPYSTKSNGYETPVRCVSGSGALYCNDCNYHCGVRPFCIFSPSIF